MATAEKTEKTGTNRSWRSWLPIAIVAAGAAFAIWYFSDWLSFDALADNRETLVAWRDDNIVLAGAVYVALYALAVAFSVPGAIWMTIAGGFLFGLVMGTLLTTLAATLGATGIFLAARTSLREPLREKAGGWLKRLDKEFEEGEISFLLIIRLIPAIPFFIANLAPAFLNVSIFNFIWTTFVGIIPGSAVFTSIGSGLGEVIERGERPDPGVIFEPHILGPLIGLALLAALPVAVRKWRKRRA